MSSSSTGASSTTTSDEAAFSQRVKKTFDYLFAHITPTPTPSSLSNPLWSLTGADVPKRVWRRDADSTGRDDNPTAASFDDFVSCARRNSRNNLERYKKELDEDDMRGCVDEEGDDDDEGVEKEEGFDCGLDSWDLRGSIGLDSTLDHEEEEDAYDKVAVGRENADGRFYMSDIADSKNSSSVCLDDFLSGIGSRQRDPRANRSAARTRLKEDDVEAAAGAEENKCPQAPCASFGQESVLSVAVGDKVKPILKRKERESTSKPTKRVRFDPRCVVYGSACEVKGNSGDDNSPEIITPVDDGCLVDEKVRRVPDYVQNPSKYTCYSLDSADEMNDKSNGGAYMDLLHNVRNSDSADKGSEQNDSANDLPISITFVPKKKSEAAKADGVCSESMHVGESRMKHPKTVSEVVSGFAAEEVNEMGVGDMEIDEPNRGISFSKQNRQYRALSQADEPE